MSAQDRLEQAAVRKFIAARLNEGHRLQRSRMSGHSHRGEPLPSLLKLHVELIDVDLARHTHKTPEFPVKNPPGRVSVIEDAEVTLADSKPILVYLASRYEPAHCWLPH